MLKPENIAVCDFDGNLIEGSNKPSSELFTHLAVYKYRSDINAIVHTHSIYASAFAAARKNIPAVTEDAAMILGGEIPCAKYAFPGSIELGENVVEVMLNKNAVLLANHGAIGAGRNLEEAYLVSRILEKSASVYLLALQVGIPKPLAIEEVEKLHEEYINKYSKI
jgi:L-fuculose-phosphate aldolase